MLESTENKLVFVVSDKIKYHFGIRILDPDDIVCYLENDDPEKQAVKLVRGVDYAVQNKSDYSNGTDVTLLLSPLPVGKTLTIMRKCDMRQELSLPEGGKLPSKPMENNFDKIFMLIQEIAEELSRCIKLDPTAVITAQELLEKIFDAKDMALDGAKMSTNAATASVDAMYICQKVLAELTGNAEGVEAALNAFAEIHEARGAVETAVEVGKTDINAATQAAIAEANRQVSEAGSATLAVLNEGAKASEEALLAAVAEATGANGVVTEMVDAAKGAAAEAGESSAEASRALASVQQASGAAQTFADQAQSVLNQVKSEGVIIDNKLANTLQYVADALAHKNGALEAKQAALEHAASALQQAINAENHALAAGEQAQIAANASITAHNQSSVAHSALFAKKLDLAGGTMTGPIIMNGGSIKTASSSGVLYILGSTDGNTGSYIEIAGKDYKGTDAGGYVYFGAKNSTKASSLKLTPDGTFTLGTVNIVRSIDGIFANAAGNVTINALPKSGGTVSGKLTFSVADAVYRNVDNATLTIGGGSAWNTGAWICLFGKSYNNGTDSPGMFKFAAQDGTNTSILVGTPKGGLSWNGLDITGGYPNYASAVTASFASLAGGSYTATADGFVTVVGSNTDDGRLKVYVNGTLVFDQLINADNISCCQLLPVKAGDVVKAEVTNAANTTGYFKFFTKK